jgi:predicted HAD superfamily hydrolase
MYSVYRRCLDRRKSIVFISDMYLPQAAIGEILKNCGYSKYDALLVSSETGETKASGRLYDVALGRVAFAPKQWLHIGDNPYSDIRMARRRGMKTWHYVSPADKFARDRRQSEAWRSDRPSSSTGYVVKGLIANRLRHEIAPAGSANPQQSFWEDFGYTTAGPLYVGFTEWLMAQVAKHDLRTVYFLARDGFILQQLFKALRPPGLAAVETHYLYASRRALSFAAIRTIDEQALRFLTQSYSRNEVGVFLKRIGLDPQTHAGAIERAGFRNARQHVKTNSDIERLEQLFRSLSEPICERAQSERTVMRDYLLNSDFSSGGRVALVDVGWNGSQQRAIQEILHSDGHLVHITGFYLGTFSFAAHLFDPKLAHDAYLFRLGQPREYQDLAAGCVEIFDLLFSAAEGSLIRMERTSSGDFVPVTQPIDSGEASRNESVESLQAGAMQFVADYLALKQDFPELAITPEVALTQLRRVLRNPAPKEAMHLGDIPHTKDFGDSPRHPIAPRLGVFALLARRRTIRRRQGSWRAGIEARSSWLYRMLYRLRMR